ncbi:MAG: alanine racemase [Spirochaetota bacterium]
MRATRALIHLEHLKHNIDQLRTHTGSRPLLCLAVKADAYGHGIAPIGLAAADFGVDYLAVATSDEGIELREAGSTLPILLYSLSTPEEIPEITAHDITPILSDRDQIDAFDAESTRQRRRLTVHLKIDTGMGRIGCRTEEAPELARRIADAESLSLGGVSTHFASSDSGDDRYTKEQIARFNAAIGAIREAGVDPGIVHAANSGGVLAHPESWYDMVRPGILAYGYYPSNEQERHLDLRPVMELVSKVVYIKEVNAGEAVSYGMTWRATHRTHIGTIPVGYGDGYNRLLSNRASVQIDGVNYPIVGRVCMDQLMVDLGPVCTVDRYADATLFGPGTGAPTAEDLAALCGTVTYEITCSVTKRVPRMYESPRQTAAQG